MQHQSHPEAMSSRERLDAAFALRQPDRTPVLGGMIACPEHIMKIAGVDAGTYWSDPTGVSIEAYGRLGADGLLGLYVPPRTDDYRCVDHETYSHARTGQSLEDALEEIDFMPGPEQAENELDFEDAYGRLRQSVLRMQEQCGDMLHIPPQWGLGAQVCWYTVFGYENYFCVVGLYPDRARKLMELGGVYGRFKARLVARAFQEGIFPPVVYFGEDICTQRGPMISPDFLEKYFLPELKRGLEPVLEVGCKPIWHCDGDVRLLLPLLFDAGIQGLQGFQPECGLTIDEVAQMRTRDGEPLVIFGPLAVTTEMPVCTPDEIRRKTRHAISICRQNGAGLCLFTSNTINPDVPLENILAMHEAAREDEDVDTRAKL